MSIKLWENGTPGYDPSFGQDEPNLTPYIVPGDRVRGCVIVCPGGGYGHLADHEGWPVARFLNNGGIHAFVLRYRLTPYHHPAMEQDVNRAVRWVRFHAAEYNVDPDHIAVLGFSAGGHLAGVAATHYDRGLAEGDEIDRVSCRPDAALLCYPVLDATMRPITNVGTIKNFLGDKVDDEKLRMSYSIPQAVTDDTPPCFLWHTAGDKGVPCENSLDMAAALHQHSIPFELHIFPYGGHGLGVAEGLDSSKTPQPHVAQWKQLAVNWLHLMGY